MELLALTVAGLLGVIWAFIKGRSEGREDEKGKQAEESVDKARQAKGVADDVHDTPADERRDRLRRYSDK